MPFHFDSIFFIVENPFIKKLANFLNDPSKELLEPELYRALKSRTVGCLTFALNYRAHGLDVTGYHVVNLTVHILNAVLLYFIVSLKVSPGEVLERITDATRVMTGMSRWEYLVTEFRVIVTYIRLLFFPLNQRLYYEHPVYHSFFEPPVVLSFLFLLSVFGVGVYMLMRSRTGDKAGRIVSFGVFWFFLTLSVESSVIPIMDVIFEHRVYLPSVGALIAVVAGAYLLAHKLKSGRMRKTAACAFVAVLIALSAATYARNTIWRSEISLWEDAVRKSPRSARAHNNLGVAYEDKGLAGKAVEHYRRALALKPDHEEAQESLEKITGD